MTNNLTASRATHEDPLFDTDESAQYLGVARHTMNVWRVDGRYDSVLPYIKVGSRVKYRKSALDAFLASRTKGGAKPEQNKAGGASENSAPMQSGKTEKNKWEE